MKLYLILFNDGKGLAPYLSSNGSGLHLYTVNLLIDKNIQVLCKLQNGQTVYTVVVKTLHSNMVLFDVTKHVNMLSSDAFWALKVFTFKCKFTHIAQIALEKHGKEQQENWLKVIGMMEPIFNGGWL